MTSIILAHAARGAPHLGRRGKLASGVHGIPCGFKFVWFRLVGGPSKSIVPFMFLNKVALGGPAGGWGRMSSRRRPQRTGLDQHS
jgi:hypothetical protein